MAHWCWKGKLCIWGKGLCEVLSANPVAVLWQGKEQPEIENWFTVQYSFCSSSLVLPLCLLRTDVKSGSDYQIWNIWENTLPGWSSEAKSNHLQLQLSRPGSRVILKMCFEGSLRNVNNVLYEEFKFFQEGQKKRKIWNVKYLWPWLSSYTLTSVKGYLFLMEKLHFGWNFGPSFWSVLNTVLSR